MKDLTEIVAPVDGTILEVADRSAGSVLREAETLVPDGAGLYMEATVPSRDISCVKVGDAVRTKLETQPFQRLGTVNGELAVISADSMPLKWDENQSGPADATLQPVCHVQVRISDWMHALAVRST